MDKILHPQVLSLFIYRTSFLIYDNDGDHWFSMSDMLDDKRWKEPNWILVSNSRDAG